MYDTDVAITCYVPRDKGFKWISFTINSSSKYTASLYLLFNLCKIWVDDPFAVKFRVADQSIKSETELALVGCELYQLM